MSQNNNYKGNIQQVGKNSDYPMSTSSNTPLSQEVHNPKPIHPTRNPNGQTLNRNPQLGNPYAYHSYMNIPQRTSSAPPDSYLEKQPIFMPSHTSVSIFYSNFLY